MEAKLNIFKVNYFVLLDNYFILYIQEDLLRKIKLKYIFYFKA